MECTTCNFEATEKTVEPTRGGSGAVLYTTHCPKCTVLENKLKEKNIEFDIVDDTSEVMALGSAVGILSAPILIADGDAMDFAKAVKWVNNK